MKSYHDTTHVDRPEREVREAKCKTQEDRIYNYFLLGRAASASMVWRAVFDPTTPLQSVRRGFTNLKDQGRLIKTDMKVPGLYGANEYVWKLAQNTQQELFNDHPA